MSEGDVPKKPRQSKDGKNGDDAFDLWLNRGLHQLFDDVAGEPIPAEILRLIEADKTKK